MTNHEWMKSITLPHLRNTGAKNAHAPRPHSRREELKKDLADSIPSSNNKIASIINKRLDENVGLFKFRMKNSKNFIISGHLIFEMNNIIQFTKRVLQFITLILDRLNAPFPHPVSSGCVCVIECVPRQRYDNSHLYIMQEI